MRKIEVLDQNTIDKIAAGEVVERPSSVVKELVENAIDAGATAVTVEITDGGKKLIRITDNGGGIEAEQVRVAFLRHATSKIRQVEDLTNIASLGFRGEALSSIAAVSCVELITKTPSALSGIRYVIEGGREQKLEEMGAPEGTTFLVRNLFYNTPARSKFLKSDATEANYISALMEQLALSHPEISFKYIQNKQVKLHSSGNYSVKDVIYNIYGRDITRSLLEVHYENDFMKVEGFLGKPEISRGNRTFENYYINGRFVKNKIITKAIEDGYKGFLMQHKFPFVSLHIEMDGNDLDVNVHPSKMEVRFARGTEVYEELLAMVRNALSGRELIPRVSVGRDEKPAKPANPIPKPSYIPEPFERKSAGAHPMGARPIGITPAGGNRSGSVNAAGPSNSAGSSNAFGTKSLGSSTVPSYGTKPAAPASYSRGSILRDDASAYQIPSGSTFTREEAHLFDKKTSTPTQDQPQEGIPEQKSDSMKPSQQETETTKDSSSKAFNLSQNVESSSEKKSEQLDLFAENLLTREARSRHKLIGQIFDTYWLVQFEDNFYIIDQHAAHEKVYYERFVKEFREHSISSQYISPPLIVSLNLEEEALLKANHSYFEKFGFEIENFGGREYSISAVPTDLYRMTEEELFLEMLDHLGKENSTDALDIFTMRLATMACKAAVKGNHKMSTAEADQLIEELLSLENPYNCPHGRPTIIAMTRAELEKKFKRIV